MVALHDLLSIRVPPSQPADGNPARRGGHGRRALIAGATAALATTATRAQADYPARPVTAILSLSAGTSNDLVGRLVAETMGRQLSVPVVIDNRPGGGGSIAATAVLRAPADGYIVFFGAGSMVINHILNPKLPPTDPQSDLVPVGTMVDLPFLIHVNADVPVTTLPGLVDYAKAHPGRLACGTSPNGSITHLALELLKQETGVDIVHIPYNAPPAMLPDLFSGRIQMAITAPLRQQQSRMLAVTSAERFAGLAEIPSVREALGLADYDAVSWQGLFVRAGTPPAIVRRLATALAAATADPGVIARSLPAGGTITPGGAEVLARLVERDLRRWRDLIERRGIRTG